MTATAGAQPSQPFLTTASTRGPHDSPWADSAMLDGGCVRPGCQTRESKMIVDCAYYQDGRRQGEGAVSLEEAAARCAQGGFVWLGLFEPGDEELAQGRD